MGDRIQPARPGRTGRRRGRAGMPPAPRRLVEAIEGAPALDRPAHAAASAAARVLGGARVEGALRGAWFGHSLHPVLTDFAEGAWMAASFLDLFGPPGSAPAARRLLGFGLAVSLPTMLTGWAEWMATGGAERRVGLVHAGASSAACVLYAWSYWLRLAGRARAATRAGVAAGLLAFADGYAAGHLSHVRGVEVEAARDGQRRR